MGIIEKSMAGIILVLLVFCSIFYYLSTKNEQKYVVAESEKAEISLLLDSAREDINSMKKDIEINNAAQALRDRKFAEIEESYSKKKRVIYEVRDDKCIDESVPAGIFDVAAGVRG
jgi:hypothetical protein